MRPVYTYGMVRTRVLIAPSPETNARIVYCTAIVAVLLITVPSADVTINETLSPVVAFCGTVMLICITPGNPGACPAKAISVTGRPEPPGPSQPEFC
jgi:hypothetical protein